MDPEQTSSDSSTSNPLLMEEIPQTLAQLNSKVQELFHCMTGPQIAYFEIPLPSHDRYESGDLPVERFVYVSLMWRTDTARDGAEARLVMAMLEPFIDARRQLVGDVDNSQVSKPLLFWRKQFELSRDDELQQLKIRCRVVIPGADLSRYARQEGALIPSL